MIRYSIRWVFAVAIVVCGAAASVRAAVPWVPSDQTASGWVGHAFSYQVEATGSPTHYAAENLPAGLSINAQTGVISGTPEAETAGSVTVAATNADGTGSGSVWLQIHPRPSAPPEILNESPIETWAVPPNRGNYPFGIYVAIQATNWPGSYSMSGLPAGFAGNKIYYNDVPPGRYRVVLRATNPLGTGSKEVDWLMRPTILFYSATSPVRAGEVAQVKFTFDSVVDVTGAPRVRMADGRYGNYAGGSGSSQLVFDFQTSPNDYAPGGIFVGEIELNGGTIQHASGVAARLANPQETLSDPPARVRIVAPPAVTSATTAAGTVGTSFSYTITATNSPYRFAADGLPGGLSLDAQTGVISGVPTASGTYAVQIRAYNGSVPEPGSATLTLTISDSPTGRPIVTTQPVSRAAAIGNSVTFTAGTSAASATYQWQYNGANLNGATASSYTVQNVEPAKAGVYGAVISDNGQSVFTLPAILAIESTAKVLGSGSEVGANIVHPNGNIYDQILTQGAAATITADGGQVTRISFVDLSDNIVQVEFGGAGTLSLVLDAASGPATAQNYNQPEVQYMRGHAGIVITGADETTNVSVFSVGRITAVNQSLFRDGVTYDGVADVAFIAIMSANGRFGGIRTANASFWATRGVAGVYAPGVQFTGPVYVCDIIAAEEAVPMLILGSAADVRVTGGDFAQTNNRAVQVGGFTTLRFADGMTSFGATLPAQPISGRLEENGADVTSRAVVQP